MGRKVGSKRIHTIDLSPTPSPPITRRRFNLVYQKQQEEEVNMSTYEEEYKDDSTFLICINDCLTKNEVLTLKQVIEKEDSSYTYAKDCIFEAEETLNQLKLITSTYCHPTIKELKRNITELIKIYNDEHKENILIKDLLKKATIG